MKNKTVDEKLDYIYCAYEALKDNIPQRDPVEAKKNLNLKRFRKSLANRRRRIVKRLSQVTSPSLRNKLEREMLKIERKLQKSYRESESYREID